MVTVDLPRLQNGLRLLDHHNPQAVLGDEGALALVVAAALLTATHPRDGVPAVEERGRRRVLLLLELDDQPKVGSEAVDGELGPTRPPR